MADLDEISFELGKLTSAVEALVGQSGTQSARMQRVEEAVRDTHLTLLANVADVAIMKPHVLHYASVRRRLAVAVAALVTLSGLGGGLIQHYIEKKWLS